MARMRYNQEDILRFLHKFEVHLHGFMGCKLMLFCGSDRCHLLCARYIGVDLVSQCPRWLHRNHRLLLAW